MMSMDEHDIVGRLEELPPAMSHPADRFEQIRDRVRRRRQVQVGGVLVASVTTVAVAVPALWQLLPQDDAAAPAGVSQQDGAGHTVVVEGQDPARSTEDPSVLPGGTETTTYGTPVAATYTGTATVDLGERPDEATGARIELTCLSPGEFAWPDGSSGSCSATDLGEEHPAWGVVDLGPGVEEVTITATDGASWRVTTTYVSTRTTKWGVNAGGDTYGVENENGTPDLIGVTATNGRSGYAYSEDLENAGGPPPTSPEQAYARQSANAGKTFSVPVYESDGETRIGEFTIPG